MAAKRAGFEHWLAEWKDYSWSRGAPADWPQLRFTERDVRQQARRALSGSTAVELSTLGAVTAAIADQHRRLERCGVFLGREFTVLHKAGGSWIDLADWTGVDEDTIRSLVRSARDDRPSRDGSPFDAALIRLLDGVPANPFRRVCELVAVSSFHRAVGRELETISLWLCVELDRRGTARGRIARLAGVSQSELDRRIGR